MKWVVLGVVALCGCDTIFGLDSIPPDAGADASVPGSWASVTIGAHHACGLTVGGALYCWGEADNGATAATTSSTTPMLVNADKWTLVSAGAFHTCGVSEGSTYCWGANPDGQVDGSTNAGGAKPALVTLPPGASTVTNISAGQFLTCALASTELYCWGRPIYGSDQHPTQVPGAWSQIAVGTDHACALDMTGNAWCWGDNSANQSSSDAAATISQPTQIMIPPARSIYSGNQASCAILTSGELWCWGSKLATGAVTTAPIKMLDGNDWIDVTIGGVLMCGTRSTGNAYCWGTVAFGGLGDGTWTETVAPTAARAIPVDHIATSHTYENDENTCVLSQGHLSCWGDNRGGIMPFPASLHATPIAVPPPPSTTWKALSSGFNHTCAIATTGTSYCWGDNDDGQISGAACATGACNVVTPTQVAASTTTIVAGQKMTCWLTADSTVKCFGANDQNQLGIDGLTQHSSAPLANASALVGGAYATCATVAGQQLCWGSIAGASGTTPAKLTPAFDTVGFGRVAYCGLAGQARTCTGYDYWGDVGDGMLQQVVTTKSGISEEGLYQRVSFTQTQVCATVNGIENSADIGDLVCWGTNYDGESAPDAPTIELISTPTQVKYNNGTLTNCTAVSTGHSVSCAICNGAPLCWGAGRNGLLGRGPANLYSSRTPDLVKVLSDSWSEISGGESHTCALASSGNLACWGIGVHGELGDGGHGTNTPVPISDPN